MNIKFDSQEALLDFIGQEHNDHELSLIALSIKLRMEDKGEKATSDILYGRFVINSELYYELKESNGKYEISYGVPKLENQHDTPPLRMLTEIKINEVVKSINNVINQIKIIRYSQQYDHYGYDQEMDREFYLEQKHITKELEKILEQFKKYIPQEKSNDIENKIKLLLDDKKIKEIYSDNGEIAESINKELINILHYISEEKIGFLPGPSLKSKETEEFETHLTNLLTENTVTSLDWKENPFAIMMGDINLLELIKKVNFRDLTFNFSESENGYEQVLKWLKESGFENYHTSFNLNQHKKKVEWSCPKGLSKIEFLFLLLYTQFTPTEKDFAFCSIINRAVMAQDKQSLSQLADIINSLESPAAKSAALSLFIAGAGLIGSGLSKLNKQSENELFFRDTFLDEDSLTLLKQSLLSSVPIQMEQFLSSSFEKRSHQTQSAYEKRTGVQAQIIILNPFGGDLSSFSPYEAEREFLLGDMPLQVLSIEGSEEDGYSILVKPVWGVGSELKPEKNTPYQVSTDEIGPEPNRFKERLESVRTTKQSKVIFINYLKDEIENKEKWSTRFGGEKIEIKGEWKTVPHHVAEMYQQLIKYNDNLDDDQINKIYSGIKNTLKDALNRNEKDSWLTKTWKALKSFLFRTSDTQEIYNNADQKGNEGPKFDN